MGQTSVNEPLFEQAVRRLQRLRAAQGELEMPDVMSNRRNSFRFALILAAISTEIDSNTRLTARTSNVSRTGCYEPLDLRQLAVLNRWLEDSVNLRL